MPANGTTALDALNWGSGVAETTSTLGVDRVDVRSPPDTSHIWGAQITAAKNLLIAMSAYFKGGARLQVVKQGSNPFGVGESGFYISSGGTAYQVVDGTPTALGGGGGGGGTLAADYGSGTTATDCTMLIQSGFGGQVIFKANGAATGTLMQTQTSGATALISFTDNASNTMKSAMADGASAIALVVDTTTAWSNSTARLIKALNNNVEKFAVMKDGAVLAPTVGPSTSQQHTLPAVSSDTFALLAATQTLAAKTLTAPVVNGLTSSGSTAIDFSGNSGTWKPPTGGLNASLAVATTASFAIGDTTHVLTKVATAKVIGGSSNTNGHSVPNAADSTFALLGVSQRFTAAQNVDRVTLTDAATVATNADLSNQFTVTLAGNRTLGNPTNLPAAGGTFVWRIKQDGTGSRTLAYASKFKFPGGIAPVLSTAAGAIDTLVAIYDPDDDILLAVLNAAFS